MMELTIIVVSITFWQIHSPAQHANSPFKSFPLAGLEEKLEKATKSYNLFVINYVNHVLLPTERKELGNMINSMKKGFIIVLVVEHHYTSLLPNSTLAVVGLHFLRVCLEL